MKRLFFLIALSLTTSALFAQKFAIGTDERNIAYIGVDNPMTIVSDKCDCANMFVETDNGKVVKTDSCHFNYKPEQPGNTKLYIKAKEHGKTFTLSEMNVRVKYLPDPHASVAGKSSGLVSLEQFKLQKGIVISSDSTINVDLKFEITSFKIKIFYQLGDYYEDIVGSHFTDNSIAAIKKLREGDRVLINQIKCVGSDKRIRDINEMMFTMR